MKPEEKPFCDNCHWLTCVKGDLELRVQALEEIGKKLYEEMYLERTLDSGHVIFSEGMSEWQEFMK